MSEVIAKAHQRLRISNNIVKSLKNLNIHDDEESILRCYGRMGRADIEFSEKYPISLLQKTILPEIIIRDMHQQSHTGINNTISVVRQQL